MNTKITSLSGIYKPMNSTDGPHFGVLRIRNFIETYPVNIHADFQRGHVWTEIQQRRFIGHVLEGGQIPLCIINSGVDGRASPVDLVDGKQRVTACIRFSDGHIPGELWDGRQVFLDDLNDGSQSELRWRIGMVFADIRCTRREALETYIRLNRGGTPHTDAEINRVQCLLIEERSRENGRS